eukprot:CAMPEP_0195132228 /NCGR_PEP_ID=MMETSP0448-20130528/146506_1 /TAXON_ID=66468 /ORGANISM="Heterocapsa triquestra, Strain CCMP 448" /LENGTH=250 /DNA_ID=CAMNT_0040170219 /DNA_START=6 /DNA_END=754 /DNA_ORIENTATION=-
MALLAFVVYIFALVLVQLSKGTPLEDELFPTVHEAMYNLFLVGIFPEQGALLRQLGNQAWYFSLVGFLFMGVATLCIINMLIGILCEVSWRTSRIEQDKMNLNLVRATMQAVIDGDGGIDCNHDGLISKPEFLGILGNKAALRALKQCGVDVNGLIESADFIFEDLDDEGELFERRLTFDEFISTVFDQREQKLATVKDITNLRKFIGQNQKQRPAIQSHMVKSQSGKSTPGDLRSGARTPAHATDGKPG